MRSLPLLLLSNDATGYNRILIQAAQRFNVKSVSIPHGLPIEPNGFDQVASDIVALWGAVHRDWFTARDSTQLIVTGNPAFDKLPQSLANGAFSEESSCHTPRPKVVLLCTGSYSGYSVEATLLETYSMIDGSRRALQGYNGNIRLRLKPHPFEQAAFYSEWAGCLEFENETDIFESIRKADVIVTSYSTVVLEALAAGKPVVLYHCHHRRRLLPIREYGVALEACNERTLGDAIRSALFDQESRNNLRFAATQFVVDHAGRLDGKASERIERLITAILSASKEPVCKGE